MDYIDEFLERAGIFNRFDDDPVGDLLRTAGLGPNPNAIFLYKLKDIYEALSISTLMEGCETAVLPDAMAVFCAYTAGGEPICRSNVDAATLEEYFRVFYTSEDVVDFRRGIVTHYTITAIQADRENVKRWRSEGFLIVEGKELAPPRSYHFRKGKAPKPTDRLYKR